MEINPNQIEKARSPPEDMWGKSYDENSYAAYLEDSSFVISNKRKSCLKEHKG